MLREDDHGTNHGVVGRHQMQFHRALRLQQSSHFSKASKRKTSKKKAAKLCSNVSHLSSQHETCSLSERHLALCQLVWPQRRTQSLPILLWPATDSNWVGDALARLFAIWIWHAFKTMLVEKFRCPTLKPSEHEGRTWLVLLQLLLETCEFLRGHFITKSQGPSCRPESVLPFELWVLASCRFPGLQYAPMFFPLSTGWPLALASTAATPLRRPLCSAPLLDGSQPRTSPWDFRLVCRFVLPVEQFQIAFFRMNVYCRSCLWYVYACLLHTSWGNIFTDGSRPLGTTVHRTDKPPPRWDTSRFRDRPSDSPHGPRPRLCKSQSGCQVISKCWWFMMPQTVKNRIRSFQNQHLTIVCSKFHWLRLLRQRVPGSSLCTSPQGLGAQMYPDRHLDDCHATVEARSTQKDRLLLKSKLLMRVWEVKISKLKKSDCSCLTRTLNAPNFVFKALKLQINTGLQSAVSEDVDFKPEQGGFRDRPSQTWGLNTRCVKR